MPRRVSLTIPLLFILTCVTYSQGFFSLSSHHNSKKKARVHWLFLHYHKTGALLSEAISKSVSIERFKYKEDNNKRSDLHPRTDADVILSHAGNLLFNWTEVLVTDEYEYRVVHFVRDPYDMVLSGLLYHSQRPAPEDWLHSSALSPCDSDPVHISRFITVLSTYHSNYTVYSLQNYINDIQTLCHTLYNKYSAGYGRPTYHKTILVLRAKHLFYEALRLEACRCILSNFFGAGGDLLRMGANAVREGQTLSTSRAPVSKRFFLTDFPIGNRKLFKRSAERMFKFLMASTLTGKEFWNGKLTVDEAVTIATRVGFVEEIKIKSQLKNSARMLQIDSVSNNQSSSIHSNLVVQNKLFFVDTVRRLLRKKSAYLRQRNNALTGNKRMKDIPRPKVVRSSASLKSARSPPKNPAKQQMKHPPENPAKQQMKHPPADKSMYSRFRPGDYGKDKGHIVETVVKNSPVGILSKDETLKKSKSNHFTQGDWPSEKRQKFIRMLAQDEVLSPILDLVKQILLYPLPHKSTLTDQS